MSSRFQVFMEKALFCHANKFVKNLAQVHIRNLIIWMIHYKSLLFGVVVKL